LKHTSSIANNYLLCRTLHNVLTACKLMCSVVVNNSKCSFHLNTLVSDVVKVIFPKAYVTLVDSGYPV